MSEEFDIIVVGGGPAGVISAYTAAKKSDYRVLLIDAKEMELIGKKTCGDALVQYAPLFLKEKLGLTPPLESEINDTVRCLVFQTPDNDTFQINGDGFIIDRHKYGQRLINEAQKAGVEIRPRHKVLRALTHNNFVIGIEVKDLNTGKKMQIYSKITIDCSGRNHVVRRTLPNDQFPLLEKTLQQGDMAASYREIIRLKEGEHEYLHMIKVIYELEIPLPGYLWIFTKGSKMLNVGIGCPINQHNGSKAKDLKKIFRKAFKKWYTPNQYEIIHAAGYTIPIRYPLLNAVANGFLTAGDAACHVNPFTVEGHAPALIAGYYAGYQAAKALEGSEKSPSMELLWEYNINIMNYFGKQHCRLQLYTSELCRLGHRKINSFLKLFSEKEASNGELKKNQYHELPSMFVQFSKHHAISSDMIRLTKNLLFIEKYLSNYPKTPKDFPIWRMRLEPLLKKYSPSNFKQN